MNRTTTSRRSVRARLVGLVAAGALILVGCGGDDDADSGDATPSDGSPDDAEIQPDDLDTSGLDTSGLDEGQLEILDDVAEGLEDEFEEDDDDEMPAWVGIRLVSSSGSAVLETLDADAFSGVLEVFSTSFPDGLGNYENGFRLIDDRVVVGDEVWVSAGTALHRVALADGTITATLSIDEVLPGGEFGDITGDSDGVFAVAFLAGGGDLIVEVDPVAGSVRGTIDVTNEVTSLLTIASNASHVAAAYKDAPGIPVKLIERASGAVTDVGNYLKLHEVQIVRDELWVIIGSGSVSEPNTYEKFGLDGSPIGSGTLPNTGQIKVFGDRIVLIETSNKSDPANPVAPVEVEPQGTPIESFLTDGMVLLTGYAEIDGFAVSSGSCCLMDDSGSFFRTAVVDMATGEVVHTADSVSAGPILPPAETP